MIDTDDYEGHTPGPWTLHRLESQMITIGPLGVGITALDSPSWKLAAAAPDLLAEVKRLREVNHQQWRRIQDLQEEINELHRGDDE